jgi:hypothetical protein
MPKALPARAFDELDGLFSWVEYIQGRPVSYFDYSFWGTVLELHTHGTPEFNDILARVKESVKDKNFKPGKTVTKTLPL